MYNYLPEMINVDWIISLIWISYIDQDQS